MGTPSQTVLDANFRAKLAARANGSVPVLVQHPEPGDIRGDDQAAVDARFRAKLEARKAKPAAAPEAKPEPKPEAKKGAKPDSDK